MISVGITGGIGSGKSTVCKRWAERGAQVVYADDLAKRLMFEDEKLISGIKDAFGSEAYHSDGSLNREYLTQEAFEKGRVETLNKLVHPRVREVTQSLIEHAAVDGCQLFVYEAALLLDHGRPEYFDAIVIVLADKKQRVARVAERDQQSESLIERKIGRQKDFSSLIHLADFTIENNGSLEELIAKADQLYDQLISLEEGGRDEK